MCGRKGFTLIELLTVIGIITLLMAILLPAVQSVRHRARAAVCQSNLRQWGIVYKMYTDEFDGKLPCNSGNFAWYYPIRNYYSNTPELLVCPASAKPSSSNGTGIPFGGTFLAWGRFCPKGVTAWDNFGSYGLNHWSYKPGKNLTDTESSGGSSYSYSYSYSSNGSESSFSYSWSSSASSSSSDEDSGDTPQSNVFWKNAYDKNADNIPLVLDCCWLYAYYHHELPPPDSDAIPRVKSFEYGNYLCMDRHSGGINSVFMDFSVRKVGLKELWTLKWYPQYDTTGPWTKAGGVKPDYWPEWLRDFKDY